MATINKEQIEAANKRGRKMLAAHSIAVAARYDRRIGRVVVEMDSGLEIAFPPRKAQGLEKATPVDLTEIEITPSGLGLHFPKIDTDLWIPGLLDGMLGTKAWMARENGHKGGIATSAAKSAAARANGKKGGRPKKNRDSVAA